MVNKWSFKGKSKDERKKLIDKAMKKIARKW